MAGVHGNEAVTTEIALNLVQRLLSHHEFDDDISRIMKGYSLHILPALNRDGFGRNKANGCQSTEGKLNQAGVDLELDYSPTEEAQPETQRIINWMDQQNFLFSINLRGSDENIGKMNNFSQFLMECLDLGQCTNF